MAICDGRFLRRPGARPWNETLLRGVTAAVVGGIAFYFMFPFFWGRESRAYSDLVKFGAWAMAWAPGILSISSKFDVRSSK
jgi:hypothetical protein